MEVSFLIDPNTSVVGECSPPEKKCRASISDIVIGTKGLETTSKIPKCRFCIPGCAQCIEACQRKGWCDTCKSTGLVKHFITWTSGNKEIDAYIQSKQMKTEIPHQYLQWIDPQEFTDVKHIADGGFGVCTS